MRCAAPNLAADRPWGDSELAKRCAAALDGWAETPVMPDEAWCISGHVDPIIPTENRYAPSVARRGAYMDGGSRACLSPGCDEAGLKRG